MDGILHALALDIREAEKAYVLLLMAPAWEFEEAIFLVIFHLPVCYYLSNWCQDLT